jgi:hypothetical protein
VPADGSEAAGMGCVGLAGEQLHLQQLVKDHCQSTAPVAVMCAHTQKGEKYDAHMDAFYDQRESVGAA